MTHLLPFLFSSPAAAAEGAGPGYHYSWLQVVAHPLESALHGVGANHDDVIRLVTMWAVCFFLIAVAAVGRLGLNAAMARAGNDKYVPGSFGVFGFFDVYANGILNMISGVLGKDDAKRFFWLFGTLFLFIFTCNVLGVIPGFLPATDNVNTNLGVALCVVVVYVAAGLKRNGMGFIKHLAGPVWWLAPLIFPIEAAGVFLIRPTSLTLRLFGNMVGDHMVFGIMSDLVPFVVPSIFLGLGIWVSFLQAFVFTLLSSIYVLLSVAHDEDDHH